MEYITQKNMLVVAALIILGGLGIWTMNSADTPSQETLGEISATTTLSESSENENVEETILKEKEDEAGVTQVTPVQVQEAQDKREDIPAKPIELGPRQKAELPGDALRLFAEAMKARDRERALSYFIENQQEQYRNVFEKENTTKQHPVVTAYFNGRVDVAELIQPKYGLYEIVVYPTKDSPSGFSINVLYDSSVGEFVITEL